MYVFLIAIFIASLTIAAVLASKIIQIGIFSVPAGILAYSITFACTDIIGEVYGKQAARSVVLAGFASLIMVM
ncbi:MAG: VUT family protein, partial [Candidatus Competibacteraceae bacterium]|nr:VUT family protein [Candidatus Competibacteraceae bacterium]